MVERYDPKTFEEGWAQEWEARALYAAPDFPEKSKKLFVMEMFPYPSGDLHVGHVENYSIADCLARYWRMKGHQVMHPMGYDAFGLPAENAAMRRKIHPREWTNSNVEQMRSSFKRLGFSYDWSREVISCNPDYYRWNQWIFLKFYERGLAYRKEAAVNWCPVDKTVLAKEQLSTGVCWQCGSEPEIRDITQWFLKITDYSDRLLDDMEGLDWSDSILSQQRNWIGRSRGAEVIFRIKPTSGGSTVDIPVFTTRPDTVWGATFFVFAPEHPVAARLAGDAGKAGEYANFVDRARRRSELERLAAGGERDGYRLPAVAINPVNDEEIPVFAADYVLMGYGTGAIMAVPAHDQRDLGFARANDLEIRAVIQPDDEPLNADSMTEAYSGAGTMTSSGQFDGTHVDPETMEGIENIIEWLKKEDKGRAAVNYRQRDWLVSRQRYWGTPIPIVHCKECGEVPVPYEDLPVALPDVADYSPHEDAVAPLARVTEWVNVSCPNCGGKAKRETDTLDTFFDSSWYFLRYCDPKNDESPFDPEKVRAWCPVDYYFGGTEHAVMHLIYARFFTKVFQEMGLVDFPEPFLVLFNQGYVTLEGRDMSKSTGHLIEATETIDAYGADASRTFMLFCSPPKADYDFPPGGFEEIGRVAHRWLSRVWNILSEVSEAEPSEELHRIVHRTVKTTTEDMESFGLNTAIAKLMTLTNEFSKMNDPVPRESAETFLKLLAPVAPFISEELWHRYGNQDSIHLEGWPSYDESLAAEETVTLVVQVNGKVRDRIEVSPTISEEEMRSLALESDKVKRLLNGKDPRKVVLVPPKIVSIVV